MTPEERTRWEIDQMKKKKRKQLMLIGYICIGLILISVLGSIPTSTPSNDDNYEAGLKLLNEEKYLEASAKFSQITREFKDYNKAKSLLKHSDSLHEVIMKPIWEAQAKEKIETLKTSLTNEINSEAFTKGRFGSKFRGSVENLQTELVVFSAWKGIINNAEDEDNEEIRKLAKTLRNKVVAFQKKEFPILRKEYGKLLADVLWESDVEVRVKGARNTVLELTGGMFAANRNIKTTQETLEKQLKMFRFKRTEYKWIEYDEEYTYYTLSAADDATLVTF